MNVTRKLMVTASLGCLMLSTSGCSVMMRMMGMGDMVDAMDNMNNAMTEETPDGDWKQKADGDVMKMMAMMKPMAVKAKEAAIARGQAHYNDPEYSGGSKGQSCNSCHPGGGSSGAVVETPMPLRDGNPAKLPVPKLNGVRDRFPKFKVPNNAVVTLATMSNNCVRMFMGGSRMGHNDQELRDLITYLGTLKAEGGSGM